MYKYALTRIWTNYCPHFWHIGNTQVPITMRHPSSTISQKKKLQTCIYLEMDIFLSTFLAYSKYPGANNNDTLILNDFAKKKFTNMHLPGNGQNIVHKICGNRNYRCNRNRDQNICIGVKRRKKELQFSLAFLPFQLCLYKLQVLQCYTKDQYIWRRIQVETCVAWPAHEETQHVIQVKACVAFWWSRWYEHLILSCESVMQNCRLFCWATVRFCAALSAFVWGGIDHSAPSSGFVWETSLMGMSKKPNQWPIRGQWN